MNALSSNTDDKINLENVYSSTIGISKAKYNDLDSLCKSNLIPQIYHSLFKNLKINNSEIGDNKLSDFEEIEEDNVGKIIKRVEEEKKLKNMKQ